MHPHLPSALVARLGPATGALGAGLLFAGLMTASDTPAETSPAHSAAGIASAYAANSDRTRAGVSIALVGLSFLLWFLGYLRERLRAAEGPNGWLHSVAFGGGLVASAGVALYLAILVAGSNEAIGGRPEGAATLLLLEWEYAGVLAPAYAALVGATSLAVIRYRLLPGTLRWIAWLGVPLASALAVAGFLGGALVVGSLLWLLVLSLAFVLRPPMAAGARSSRDQLVGLPT